MKNEKEIKSLNGYVFIALLFLLLGGGIYLLVTFDMIATGAIMIALAVIIMTGFFLVNPNDSKILLMLGKYKGTVKENGFYWANPIYGKRRISLRALNFDSERIKVNDKKGNPIMISGIVVWRVNDTYKAAFDVSDYASFVKVQSEAALRELAGSYAYDNFDEDHEITLRSGSHEVNHALETQLRNRLAIAGIEVIEARIGYLAYAPEIASAMLRRQQAEAVVAARMKIVEGAVGMVEMALDQLSKKDLMHLDEDKKAAMVSNLMVVLCADKDVTPVVNTGTLHQ